MSQASTDPTACDVRCIHPDAVDAARASLADRAERLDGAQALFAALGDPTRLRLLAALQAGPLCTCDLAATLGVTESAVSHQLRGLRALRLVASERDGKMVYHRLDDDHVAALLSVAAEHVAEGAVENETSAADTPLALDA
ncbi:MAG: transcriptional regulator [Rhodothermaceae bacterium]|nr:transcriptional regulator [Rhodothermaceae bacterium]